MLTSQNNEIKFAKKIHPKTGEYIIVMRSNTPGIYNTFNTKFRKMFSGTIHLRLRHEAAAK